MEMAHFSAPCSDQIFKDESCINSNFFKEHTANSSRKSMGKNERGNTKKSVSGQRKLMIYVFECYICT